jgi:hypothetical protein
MTPYPASLRLFLHSAGFHPGLSGSGIKRSSLCSPNLRRRPPLSGAPGHSRCVRKNCFRVLSAPQQLPARTPEYTGTVSLGYQASTSIHTSGADLIKWLSISSTPSWRSSEFPSSHPTLSVWNPGQQEGQIQKQSISVELDSLYSPSVLAVHCSAHGTRGRFDRHGRIQAYALRSRDCLDDNGEGEEHHERVRE